MRTITLELLRHGTTHGQLLSPLTPYLALCENHAAVTVHLPFEHNQFLFRLSALSYKFDDDSNEIQSRIFQLQDTARVLGEILSEIPGLTAESNKKESSEENLTHLRLIISASELALLPFELALSPNGLPGAGQHLLLQPQMPICLTREIRRVSDENIRFPDKPRILFIAAAPPEVGAIPLESHLLVLRRLISPWVYYYDENDTEKRNQRVEEHFHFLPGASIEAIEEACATGNYTHIHILAHGVEVKENYDTRFRLALHNALNPDKADYISGSRLATALRASTRPDNRGISLPVVVTLASCDSGNVGSVAGAGSSIAHALHEAGIPLVVAGQFPLSFEGSVRLVECLYEGLLWGTDPRLLLYDLRRRLYAQFNNNHDWASLVTYVSLPKDFDTQLQDVKIERAGKSIDAAMNHADEATRRLSEKLSKELSTALENTELQAESQSSSGGKSKKPKGSNENFEAERVKNESLVKIALEKIGKAKERLERLLKSIPNQSSRINGRLASTEKRHAEILFRASKNVGDVENAFIFDTETRNRYVEEHKKLLQKSRDYYWYSFLTSRSEAWAIVQYISLTLIMQKSPLFPLDPSLQTDKKTDGEGEENLKKDLNKLWSLAHLFSIQDLNSAEKERRIWSYGNLIELHLLSFIMKPGASNKEESRNQALDYTNALIEAAGRDSFMLYSTRRQVLRYTEWFSKIAELDDSAVKLADDIFKKFPKDIEEIWK